jgi:hypothetical protein
MEPAGPPTCSMPLYLMFSTSRLRTTPETPPTPACSSRSDSPCVAVEPYAEWLAHIPVARLGGEAQCPGAGVLPEAPAQGSGEVAPTPARCPGRLLRLCRGLRGESRLRCAAAETSRLPSFLLVAPPQGDCRPSVPSARSESGSASFFHPRPPHAVSVAVCHGDLLPRRLRPGCFRSRCRHATAGTVPRGGDQTDGVPDPGAARGVGRGRQASLGGGASCASRRALLHPNEVVSTDRLIDELWGEDSSERARRAAGQRLAASQGAFAGRWRPNRLT